MAENGDSSYDAQPVSYSDDEHAHSSAETTGNDNAGNEEQQQQSGEQNGNGVTNAKNLYVSNLDPKV